MTQRLKQAFGDRYTIECELGQGAMGVVYRARDRHLDRPVALKVLYHDGAGPEEVLARFGREAKILASINSPGIAGIHGYEVVGDTHVLVLELIEGVTLRERLEQGPIPLAQVITVCGDIAAALKSAHDLGIIHCDLKPENVKITPKGVVKVLDFGIAMRTRTSSGRPSWPQIPVASLQTTRGRGAVQPRAMEEQSEAGTGADTTAAETWVGTPPYMSPEQVLREPLSNRTDTWAFGCLLFECLAGQSPFERRTLPETLMAVVGGEPDWTVLPRLTPQRLRTLLQRCLEKDLAHRLPDMSEARHELQVTALETSPDRPTAAKPPTHNLPTAPRSFIGRAQEAKHVAATLDRTGLVTLIGPGGAGKTRLATEVGFHLLESFADGVWLFELTADADPLTLPRVLAAVLGISADSTADLVHALQPKQMLLVLDGGERALSECADLAGRLLSDCPSLSILAVGTQRLGLVGETAFAVPPLECPASSASVTLAEVHEIESVQLFVDCVRSSMPEFMLMEETTPAVAQICRALRGIPLGIELAAAQVKAVPVDRLAQLLLQEFDPPAHGRPTVSEFGQAARRVIEWGIQRLSGQEVTLLRRLAVFSGGWTMEGAQAVCEGDGIEDVFDVLARLTELSFVYVENRGDQTRYRMPNAIRERACELLQESSDHTVMRRRHCEFFLGLAERAEPALTGPEQATWHGRLQADAANLRTAFAEDAEEAEDLWAQSPTVQQETLFRRLSVFRSGWTLAAADAVCGGDGVAGIPALLDQLVEQRLVVVREQDDELRYEMPAFVRRRARERLHAAGEAPAIGRRYRAFFLKLAEESHDGLSGPRQSVWLRRLQADHANLRDAAGSYDDPDEADESLRLIAALSRFWDIGGHLQEGRQLSERALSKFEAKADPVVTANALAGAARLAVRAGDLVAAQANLERADHLFRAADEKSGIAEVLNAQANVALRRGSYAQARAPCEESLSLHRELGDKRGVAWSLLTLGEVAYRNGDHCASLRFREEALASFREVDDPSGLAWALTNVGKSAFHRGDFSAARAYHAESLAVHRKLGDRPGAAWSLSSLAHVALARADFREACALLEESLVLSKQAGNAHGVAWSLVHLANVAYHEGELRTAYSLLMEGLALFRQLQVDGGCAWCLVAMGYVAYRRGKLRSAHTLLAESLVTFTKLGEKRGVASALRGWSLLAAAVGAPYKASQLLGAAEALGDEMGEKLIPPEQREFDDHVDALRDALGEAQFDSALKEGRAMSPVDTVRLALRDPGSSSNIQGAQLRRTERLRGPRQ
ncbi:MAG: tetratricopeptide repeat protein [Gemmatimonadota bacterium]|nr:MAG: tetratricopeptide repeat protein [Gemmatimonadota bacterium]